MSINSIHQQIIQCTKCPRLRNWCEKIAVEKRKSFANETYWGKPITGFGDENAEFFIVGLAPAAHGANRTGRMFTGDNSGKWLYRALHEHGFSNQEESTHANDSLQLKNTYVTSVVHCAPPDNKPSNDETNECMVYLRQELQDLKNVKVILALGQFAWKNVTKILKERYPKDKIIDFGHNVSQKIGPYVFLGSYHPSQQNTFTKKLTKPMFDQVFANVKNILSLN